MNNNELRLWLYLMMKPFENIQDTLSFYGQQCNKPYYISSGDPIFKFPVKPFRMDYYAFCICTSGNIQVDIDGSRMRITDNQLLMSAPSTIMKVLERSDDFCMKLLFFDKTFLLKNVSDPFILNRLGFFQLSNYRIIDADVQQAEKLLRLLSYLEEKSTASGRFIEETIRTIMFHILLEAAELIHDLHVEQHTEHSKEIYFRFQELIQESIQFHRDVRFYAEQLNVSNKNLIKIVKQASGKTPHEIIDEALLKEAIVYLNTPSANISDIAFKLNFNSIAAFSRFFKKMTACSPSDYRGKK